MTAIDDVFRPLEQQDPIHRTEPISVKKLKDGDACWSTCKKVLGWIIDSVAMTLTLPPRRLHRLAEILVEIPRTQRRLSLDKWYKLLGELRSMSIALPGARGLFSHLQAALRTRQGPRLRLTDGFHQALDDFRWLHDNLASRPTRLYELVPTNPSLIGTHDASGAGAGGLWLPHPTIVPRPVKVTILERDGKFHRPSVRSLGPIVWRHQFPLRFNLHWSLLPTHTAVLLILNLNWWGVIFTTMLLPIVLTSANEPPNPELTTWPHSTGIARAPSPPHPQLPPSYANKPSTSASIESSLALISSTPKDAFIRDLRLAQADVSHGVDSSNAKAATAHWSKWETFCSSLNLDPTLTDVQDPIPFLQVFAFRFRTGRINTTHRPVRSRTVEGALRSIGQTFASVGGPDPRFTAQGQLDFRLKRMLSCYSKQDTPPMRVKPIPVPLLRHIMAQAYLSPDLINQALADMICLAFFFLLRPGEYTGTTSDTQPFTLQDIEFYLGGIRQNKATAHADVLLSSTFVTFEFTNQKNSVRGEVIGLGRSGDPHFYPVTAAACRVLHLRHAFAIPTQPLASYLHHVTNRLCRISPSDLTQLLRHSAQVLGPTYGFLPKDISARSLRAAGAMALLCANVDSDWILILGRWRSDEMLRYLHVQAEPIMRHFSSRMLSGGNFTLLPNHEVPLL